MSRKLNVKNVAKGLQAPALTTAGFVGGAFIVTFLNNLVAKASAGSVSGLMSVAQKYGVPALVAVAGVFAPDYLKLGPAGAYSKPLFTGISSYGAFNIVKTALGKDLLSGYKGVGALMNYTDPVAGGYRLPAPRITLPGTRMLSGAARSL